MRQFGSSLNHNGMSLFIATVPGDTELYHGTSTKDRVNGTQWLAFEPEHALIFARGRRGPPPGPPPGEGQYTEDAGKEHELPGHRPKRPGGKDRPRKEHGDEGCHRPSRNESRPDAPPHSPPPPHHQEPPRHDKPPRRCPPGEGHLPCPGHPGESRHEPPRRGPPFKHHGSPEHHGPPSDWFEHRGENHDDRDHHKHHGPPPHEMDDEHDDLQHDHPEHHGFHIPSVGFWVHRLGDLLRNPKRRHVPAVSPREAPQLESIESRDEQEPLVSDRPEDQSSGYLHTYRTKHSLRLLYVDGQSAAKSKKGTLDTQDVLLLANSIDHDSGMFGERERAAQLCKLANERWGNRIDGILRMEGGFEIILCDFAAHLEIVSIAKTKTKSGGGFGGGGDNGDGFNYYRAVAARYHDIGGGRVVLDYEHFVSTFAYPEAIYFDDTGRPRINNESSIIDDVRLAVDQMILHKAEDTDAVNWRAIADMVIARYADRIEYLASGSLSTLSALQAEIERALRPFINYSARNSTSEIERCASQFLPDSTTSTHVAAQAVRQVTHALCTSLTIASEQTDYAIALKQVKQLKNYLAWTTWKQCRGCAADEICFLPIWPVGTAEDFEQPKCRSDVSLAPGHGDGDRYWNDFGGPGRRGSGSKGRREKRV
ncbi:hypothetical protein KCU62_g6561, partial [Aureobasidium sp. EXF-3399]